MTLGTTVANQNCVITVDAYIGPGAGDNQLSNAGAITSFNWQSGASLTASTIQRLNPTIAANTTGTSFNLGTLFSVPPIGPVLIAIVDATIPGVGFQITTTGGTLCNVGPSGFWMFTPNTTTGTLPTVTINNTSLTSAITLLITLIGS